MKIELRNIWVWVGIGIYTAYTVAMVLPFLTYLYSIAVLGYNSVTADYAQVQAMKQLIVFWFVSTVLSLAAYLFISAFFAEW